MIPSFRGEDRNPGSYEMFYGELEDLDAAYDWLAKQPWVDPDRIYLAGHSTGGTPVCYWPVNMAINSVPISALVVFLI